MLLDKPLAQLENAQLVRRLTESEVVYIFKNVLTQDAAYQSLLVKQRRHIHTFVAQAHEELYADRLDEFAAVLARHYAEAGADAKTIEYATRAGDAAARVYANAEAIAHYTQALEIAKATLSPDVQSLYLKRGRIYEINSQHGLALANYEEMEALAREQGNRTMELAALIAHATIHSIPSPQFDVAHAKVLCDQALTLARAIGDQPAQAKVLWNLMLLNSRLGTHYRAALGYGEQAIEIARACNLSEQLAYLLNDITLLYVWEGDPERGMQINLEARQMWRTMNNLPMLSDNLSYVTMAHVSLGEYTQAVGTSREALEISQSIGNLWGESFSQSWVGQAYRELGEIEQAITAMENAIRFAAHGFQAPLSFTRADLAALYGDMGQIERGIELVKLAKVEGEKLADVMNIWTCAQFAHLYLLEGNIPSAELLVDDTNQRITTTQKASIYSMRLLLVEAELAIAQTDYSRAIGKCDYLINSQHARRLRQYLPDAFYLKGVAFWRQEKLTDAIACLDDARSEAASVNSRWTLWRILATLAEIEIAHGNQDQAQSLRQQAREYIEFIAAHSPQDLRASFLNLPDVSAVMKSRL